MFGATAYISSLWLKKTNFLFLLNRSYPARARPRGLAAFFRSRLRRKSNLERNYFCRETGQRHREHHSGDQMSTDAGYALNNSFSQQRSNRSIANGRLDGVPLLYGELTNDRKLCCIQRVDRLFHLEASLY